MGLGTYETLIVAGSVFIFMFIIMYVAKKQRPDKDYDLMKPFSEEIHKNRKYKIRSEKNSTKNLGEKVPHKSGYAPHRTGKMARQETVAIHIK